MSISLVVGTENIEADNLTDLRVLPRRFWDWRIRFLLVGWIVRSLSSRRRVVPSR